MTFRRCTSLPVALCLITAFAASRAAQSQTPAVPKELESVRVALDKYKDPIVAVHDGFYSSLGCISYPNGAMDGAMKYPKGAMGVHFINMGNIGPKLDPAKPQVLIYEPAGDKLKLVAAEWFVPTELAGGKAPVIFGQTLGGPMEGHQPVMPAELHHYDLHVWLWKNNPEGVFSPTNPAVKCPATGYSFAEAAPKMAHDHK